MNRHDYAEGWSECGANAFGSCVEEYLHRFLPLWRSLLSHGVQPDRSCTNMRIWAWRQPERADGVASMRASAATAASAQRHRLLMYPSSVGFFFDLYSSSR